MSRVFRQVWPDWKPAPTRKRRRTDAEARGWRESVGPCLMCGRTRNVDPHHVLYEQALRRRGLDRRLWDTRNRVWLCRSCHEAHHNRSRPVPKRLLPDTAIVFAREYGLEYLLDRWYPTYCPDCGDVVINAGAHAEACTGVFRCADPEQAWIRDVAG